MISAALQRNHSEVASKKRGWLCANGVTSSYLLRTSCGRVCIACIPGNSWVVSCASATHPPCWHSHSPSSSQSQTPFHRFVAAGYWNRRTQKLKGGLTGLTGFERRWGEAGIDRPIRKCYQLPQFGHRSDDESPMPDKWSANIVRPKFLAKVRRDIVAKHWHRRAPVKNKKKKQKKFRGTKIDPMVVL